MTAGRWLSWSVQIPQFLISWWPAMKAGGITMTQRPRYRVPSGSTLALPDPRRPDRASPPTNFRWSLFWQHWHDLHALGSHWTDSQQEIICWGFKGVQEEIPSEEASCISTRTMHQSITPFLLETIWPRWASRQFLSLPIVMTLLPVTFGYSPSARKTLQSVVKRQLRRWKRLWRRSETRSHKLTSMGPSRSCWNGKKKQCSRRLLRRGLDFHVCTSNKSAHTKKSWNLLWTPYLSIYLSTLIYMHQSISLLPVHHTWFISIYLSIYLSASIYMH